MPWATARRASSGLAKTYLSRPTLVSLPATLMGAFRATSPRSWAARASSGVANSRPAPFFSLRTWVM